MRHQKKPAHAITLPDRADCAPFYQDQHMATIVKHRNVNIVTLEAGEAIEEHCNPGDIALEQADNGWWTRFVGANGEIDSYDTPFNTYNESLWAAKAAAEFGLD
jgi:hypothetical protein